MARDTRLFETTVRHDTYVVKTGEHKTLLSGSDTSYTTASGRDDSVSTSPRNGSYVLPTEYWAYRYLASGNKFDYEYLQSGSTAYRRVGTSFFDDILDAGAGWKLGTTGTITGSTPRLTPNTPASLISRVDGNVRSQINNMVWDAGNSLGELPETIDAIYGMMETVYNLYKAIKSRNISAVKAIVYNADGSVATAAQVANRAKAQARRKKALGSKKRRRFDEDFAKYKRWKDRQKPIPRKGARAIAQGFSSGWLFYKFFWLPILQDIHSALEAMEAAASKSGAFRASASGTAPMGIPGLQDATCPIVSAQFSGTFEVKVEVAYKVSNPLAFSLSQHGLTNPLSLAWELLPLSFVLDWFVSVGSFMSALSRPWGLVFDWGYRTEYVKWHAKYAWIHAQKPLLKGEPESAQASLVAFQRNQYLGMPVPVPYFRGIGLSADKIVTLAALIAK